MTRLEARPAIDRTRVHATITEQQISDLVDRFYAAVRTNERLAPIFQHHIEGWDAHFDRMKAFWRSVLLKTGEYKGKPVPVHLRIEGIGTEDFEEWLRLFSIIAADVFHRDAAVLVNDAARGLRRACGCPEPMIHSHHRHPGRMPKPDRPRATAD